MRLTLINVSDQQEHLDLDVAPSTFEYIASRLCACGCGKMINRFAGSISHFSVNLIGEESEMEMEQLIVFDIDDEEVALITRSLNARAS